jgi:DNA replication protein DnaC
MTTTDHTKTELDEHLSYLKLVYISENYESLAKKAVQKQWTHVNYLTELTTAEANQKKDRATTRRIRAARFPQIKTLEQFKWSWPQKINQLQVKNLFRLSFIEQKSIGKNPPGYGSRLPCLPTRSYRFVLLRG